MSGRWDDDYEGRIIGRVLHVTRVTNNALHLSTILAGFLIMAVGSFLNIRLLIDAGFTAMVVVIAHMVLYDKILRRILRNHRMKMEDD